MRNILLLFLISNQFLSQIIINPTSTLVCNSIHSIVGSTINLGTPPYNYTVQAPPCASNYTTSSANGQKTFTLNCAGIYTIIAYDASNTLIGTINHTVIAATKWVIPIESNADTICVGIMPTFSIRDTNNVWSDFKYTNVTWSDGETGLSITVSPTITTTYSLTGLYTSSVTMHIPTTRTCTIEGYTTIAVVTTTPWCNPSGITELSTSNQVNCYPNPCKEKIIIEAVGINEIELKNLFGQSVYILNNPSSKQEIDTQNLPRGVYFLKAGILTKPIKIIKD